MLVANQKLGGCVGFVEAFDILKTTTSNRLFLQ
jgi:hypothetical protein